MYGLLISVKLGTQLVVVASSPHSAAEILKTQDRFLSAQSPPSVAPYELSVIDQHSIVFSSDLSNHWKFFGRVTVCFEGEKSFLRSKKEETVKISKILFGTILNTKFIELGAMPNISEFYPLFEALDLQGLRKQSQVYQNQLINIWSEIVKEKGQAINHSSSNFLDTIIDSRFLDLQINILLTMIEMDRTQSCSLISGINRCGF
ncbi:hypothetical protein H5410_016700 [Solanum commersonii]|uniref:Uncharacterized protein n=1 Tax=Solanum commersonii TaxID=4109 RepID=A0A9J5ZY49_SOLCO|nr:hypothetical protein H5410_016700 [Solanum commersonii]